MYYFIKYITTYVGEYNSIDNNAHTIIHLSPQELEGGVRTILEKIGGEATSIVSITPLIQ